MSKKIKNTNSPKPTAMSAEDINRILYKEKELIIDFSYEGAFVSCKCGDFNNFLLNQNDFIIHFRNIMNTVNQLSGKKTADIFNGSYRHCHKIDSDEKETSLNIIKCVLSKLGKDDSYYEQIIGGEELYQIGLNSEDRLYGIIQGNIFRVYFIDYYHDLYFDKRRNERNKKYCDFCPTFSDI